MCFDFDGLGDVGDEREEGRPEHRKNEKKSFGAAEESVPEHVWGVSHRLRSTRGSASRLCGEAVAEGSATNHLCQGGVCVERIANSHRTVWSRARSRTKGCRIFCMRRKLLGNVLLRKTALKRVRSREAIAGNGIGTRVPCSGRKLRSCTLRTANPGVAELSASLIWGMRSSRGAWKA